ncbi:MULTISPECIES: cation transporter [unclassified Iodidimonas]|uniref:heavy-metal-associated domain-containing protein n=1 Tax=unclassified Iodidimonas TaxID=2626145 RepID=UPI0024830567|nr:MULTISPECIES: cation transporter [unclassified Iodidimonas]
MKKIMLVGLLIGAMAAAGLVIGLDMLPGNTSAKIAKNPKDPTPATASEIEATLQQVTFAVENMTCALCPVTVKKAMAGVDGVSAVEVDFERKTARASFDPKRTTLAQIAAASTDAGYPAHAVE